MPRRLRKRARARAATLKRKASSRKPPPTGGTPAPQRDTVDTAHVTLLTNHGASFKIDGGLLEQLSIFWSYVVRTRARWAAHDSSYRSLAGEARERLAEWGVTEDHLKVLAEASVVEVQIPSTDDREWAARTLPWESLIATATYPDRKGPLLIVRNLDVPQAPAPRYPERMLFVQSAPARLAEFYSFDEERKLVESSLALEALPHLKDPTRARLQKEIRSGRPDIVHVTAIDLHQGAALLGNDDDMVNDGVYLAGDTGLLDPVLSNDFASLFVSPGVPPPAFVACNFYHSAAQIAPDLLTKGVGAALSFQDEVDDRLVERFYGTFYRAWRENDWNLVEAFRTALSRMSAHTSMRGTGVVLWSATSLLRPSKSKRAARKAAARPKSLPALAGPGTGKADARDWFAVEVKPPREINYSLLHNREQLFEKFTIAKLWPGPAEGISVEVQLFVGEESFPYRTSVALSADAHLVDLASLVHVPLLSRFLRGNRENVNTCLYVNIEYQGRELRRDTFPVTLLAVDEWKFNPNDDSRWLASFVLPRDPAVLRVVNAAQRYVTSLRDDIGAGFDGYQSTDPEAEDPDAGIDLQVRAIWSALVNDIPLGYINPPPTFTQDAQRLRTPSDTIDGQRGTCIDLALLFAACLEYVEIYPVVFVLKDHAFPGYWRNADSHDRFLEMKTAIPAGRTAKAESRRSFDEFDEVTQLVNSGDLVPLETVWLTQRRGFQEAIDAGLENLINRDDFGALLDVKHARSEGVTPLPIAGGTE